MKRKYTFVRVVERLTPDTLRNPACDTHMPDCGTREALESIGVTAEEQEKILDTIHAAIRHNTYCSTINKIQ